MKTLMKLVFCNILAFNIVAMECLEDVNRVNHRLETAVISGDPNALNYLLSDGCGEMPSQEAFENAFRLAASMKKGLVVQRMMEYPTIRPTERCIIDTYFRELGNSNEAIAMLLEQEIFRMRSLGEVADSISLTDSLPSLDKRVAVFQNIYNMMRGIPLIAYDLEDDAYDARSALEQAIMNITLENQQEEVQVLLFNRIDVNPDYQKQICILLTFMQTFKPDHKQKWLEEFVREFGGGRGLKESIIRSLMNIDPELSSFFIRESYLG